MKVLRGDIWPERFSSCLEVNKLRWWSSSRFVSSGGTRLLLWDVPVNIQDLFIQLLPWTHRPALLWLKLPNNLWLVGVSPESSGVLFPNGGQLEIGVSKPKLASRRLSYGRAADIDQQPSEPPQIYGGDSSAGWSLGQTSVIPLFKDDGRLSEICHAPVCKPLGH